MDNVLSMLGLATRARKIVTGESFVVDAIRNKRVYLVFLASDAGKNTFKRVTDKAKYYNVDVCTTYTSYELSAAIGKDNRMVVGILDNGFDISIMKKGCDCYGKKDEEKGGTNQ